MVLKDRQQYTSLRNPSTDNANKVSVLVPHGTYEGRELHATLYLKTPLTLESEKIPLETINAVVCREVQGSKFQFEVKIGKEKLITWSAKKGESQRINQYLQQQHVNVKIIRSGPIINKNPRASHLPQKPVARSHLNSTPIVPLQPSNPARTVADGMFSDLSSSIVFNSQRQASSASSRAPSAPVSSRVQNWEPTPPPPPLSSRPLVREAPRVVKPRKPPMLSGDNSGPPKERPPKRVRKPSTSDRPKRRSPPPAETALVEPTDEFIKTITQSHKPIKYKHPDGRTTTLSIKDIGRLQQNVFLDDSLISFFLKVYQERMENPDLVYVFSTFFYARMDEEVMATRWAKKVDFSKKRIIIIPIHYRVHWSAVVISGVDKFVQGGSPPTMVYFDSLGATHSGSREVFKKCVKFMTEVFKLLPSVETPQSRNYTKVIANVPVQSNLSDCGIFMLEFMRYLMADPERYERALKLTTRSNELQFTDMYEGKLDTRQDYLNVLKTFGEKHPDMSVPSEGELSDLEVVENGTMHIKRTPAKRNGSTFSNIPTSSQVESEVESTVKQTVDLDNKPESADPIARTKVLDSGTSTQEDPSSSHEVLKESSHISL